MIRQGMDKDMSLKAIRQAQLKMKEIVFGFYKDMQNEEGATPKPPPDPAKSALPFQQEQERFPVNPKPVPEKKEDPLPQELDTSQPQKVLAKPEPQPQNVEPKVQERPIKP